MNAVELSWRSRLNAGLWPWLLSVGLVIAMASVSSANAPPPLPRIWFYLSDSPPALSIQSAQLVGCEAIACQSPVLLSQQGTCSQAGCVAGPPLFGDFATLQCTADTCLAVEDPFIERSPPYFRLALQFPDRLRTSPAFPARSAAGYRTASYWQVRVLPTALQLEHLAAPAATGIGAAFWRTGLGLTLLLELGVGALWLRRRRADRAVWGRTLLTIALVHSVTLPVVWFFFPSLQPFQYTFSRVFGAGCLLTAIAYAVVCWGWPRLSSRWLVWGTLAGVPLALLVSLVVGVIVGYGESLPSTVAGLSPRTALIASELFAWLYEAALLYRLSRHQLTLPETLLLSLAMNGVSLAVGLALWNVI